MHPNGIPLKEIPSLFHKATINRPIRLPFNRVVDILKGTVHLYVICTQLFPFAFLAQNKEQYKLLFIYNKSNHNIFTEKLCWQFFVELKLSRYLLSNCSSSLSSCVFHDCLYISFFFSYFKEGKLAFHKI